MSYRSLSADNRRKEKFSKGDEVLTSQSNQVSIHPNKIIQYISKAHILYNQGQYQDALQLCEASYELDACRTDNLLLLGALHFQLRNYPESVFYNQQCIRVDGNFAEAYSNLGNALKELGDLNAAIQFYMKAVKLKPRYGDAYNNLASAYVQLGRIKDAIETYDLAITINPGLVDAHSNLGNLLKATGNIPGAKKAYLEAIRLKPDFAIAWNNLAGVFKDDNDLNTALEYYKEALRLVPDFADAHSNIGNVYRAMNQLPAALQSYQAALHLRPDFAIAHGNHAACLYDMGDIAGAIKGFKHAIHLEYNYPDVHNNLGNAYLALNRVDDAILCYRATLQLKPDHPYAYNNLGNALKDKLLFKEAMHCYVTAIRLMPMFAPAHSNLASIFKAQGKITQAVAHYKEAIAIDPSFADAYSNLGNVYKDINHFDDAIENYMMAIKIRPDYAEAYGNLAATYKDTGRLIEAQEYYRQALSIKPTFIDAYANLVHTMITICDWSSYDESFKRLSDDLSTQVGGLLGGGMNDGHHGPWVLPSIQPFHSLAYPLSLSELQIISQRYALRAKQSIILEANDDKLRFTFTPKPRYARIHIGYVSSDFGNHPLSHLMQSVFGSHDRSKFEVTCYALSSSDRSPWRDKIEVEVEHFKDISALSYSEAAQVIHADKIHILVNLNGYTKGARNEIFALRPAPIQLSYLGFCGTMGADYIDYMVADSITIPSNLKSYYTEKIITLPHSYFVNDHRQSCRQVVDKNNMPTRQQYNISEDAFVFCNFNQVLKFDPTTFDTWMNILKRVPNAVLWLLRFPPLAEENLRLEARKRGILDDRIIFTDVAPRDEHIKRGFLADLFLDTPMYNAHTTGCDILWGGTPIVTLPGEKMSSRVAASLLHATGLSELVTSSYAEYEELAVSLALDPNRLYSMRLHLEVNRDTCPCFDTTRWIHNYEAGLLAVWKRRESGMTPDHIAVEDNDPVIFKDSNQLL